MLDVEEAKIQAAARKEMLDRAKKLQYMETDKVKALQGALLLTEVLKEREKQLGRKSRR